MAATRVFTEDGWELLQNKNWLECALDSFCKGPNPWKSNVFRGEDPLNELCVLWEKFVKTKPVPKRKTQKSAFIYALATVSNELSAQVKELNIQFKEFESIKDQLDRQHFKLEAVEIQNAKLEAQLAAVMSQCDQAEDSLIEKVAALNDSQATVRQLLKEAGTPKPGVADHTSCQREIANLRLQVSKARGVVSAVSPGYPADWLNANGGSEVPPLDCYQGGEGNMAPVIVTEVHQPGQSQPTVKYERKSFSPEQARVLGKNLGKCCKETILNWMAKVRTQLPY